MVGDERVRRNARDLELELDWFARVLDTRFKLYFSEQTEYRDVFEVAPPALRDADSDYARFLRLD